MATKALEVLLVLRLTVLFLDLLVEPTRLNGHPAPPKAPKAARGRSGQARVLAT